MATENTTWNDRNDPYEIAMQQLAARVRGRPLRPGDAGYDEARVIWQGAVDRHPQLIMQAADAGDVMSAVRVARELDLPVAIRSGGHSMAGHSISDGLVIDLSGMKGMTVDPERRVARVEPGRTWGAYAQEAGKHGLATSSGDVPSVGVGGLVLGGGIGWMVRKHGLTIDHLRSVEVVTADARLLRASHDENPDLFWALRGGGGNFGIATSFELDLKPAPQVIGGAVFYDAAHGYEILRAWAKYAEAAPDELTTTAVVMSAPPAPFMPPEAVGKLVVGVLVCYTGDVDDGERVVAPLRRLDTLIADSIAPVPYPAMFQMGIAGTVKGLRHHDRSMYLPQLDDVALKTITAHMRPSPTIRVTQIRILGGAMSRVPEEETAFAHRDKQVLVTISTAWRDAAVSELFRAWLEDYWGALRPYAEGVYVNFLGDEGEARVREAYKPATYARLVALKTRYDPANVFRLNQNIKPTGARAADGGDHADSAA